jgi:hypothetical protein
LELSGPCVAWAYKAIKERPLPELLIILALVHSVSDLSLGLHQVVNI